MDNNLAAQNPDVDVGMVASLRLVCHQAGLGGALLLLIRRRRGTGAVGPLPAVLTNVAPGLREPYLRTADNYAGFAWLLTFAAQRSGRNLGKGRNSTSELPHSLPAQPSRCRPPSRAAGGLSSL